MLSDHPREEPRYVRPPLTAHDAAEKIRDLVEGAPAGGPFHDARCSLVAETQPPAPLRRRKFFTMTLPDSRGVFAVTVEQVSP